MFPEIDGSILEGGGQILRIAVCLSALYNKPITIQKIRANRKKNGLAPQHLAGIHLARDLSQAFLINDFLRSTELTFIPKLIRSGTFVADTQTGGSVALLLQVSLPLILFGNDKSHLTLKGGTNTDFAPPIDYTINVFKPMVQKFGIDFECEINRRGFIRGNGSITVSTNPVKKLNRIILVEFGELESITGEAYVSGFLPYRMAEEMATAAERVLKRVLKATVSIKAKKFNKSEAFGNGSGINLYAKTSAGCHLGSSVLGKRGVSATEIGTKAAKALMETIFLEYCVDSCMQDQLIIYMALAEGRSRVKMGPITLHTETAIHVTELLTGVKFDIYKLDDTTNIIECFGIGFQNKNII
ncbi:hypothetical protein RUM43_004398 [Polyplax serrata]|uniref:RNA 3'-terminal phosphate cyclase n=1 Tax=Polyplax serrata TaxID=468196 RepID=A0AAN8XN37_POLSC